MLRLKPKPKQDPEDKEELNKIKENVTEPLDDGVIREMLPDCKILKYSELKNYSNINQLLPKVGSHVIILFESAPNNGHWTALLRPSKNEIEFFDSYGNDDVKILNWISKDTNNQLGVYEPYLYNLLKKSPYRCVYNKIKYQKDGNNIASCGRHCSFRIKCLLDGNMNIKQYYNFMKAIKNKSGLSYDDIVSGLVDPDKLN